MEVSIGWIKGGYSVFFIILVREGNKYLIIFDDVNNKVWW